MPRFKPMPAAPRVPRQPPTWAPNLEWSDASSGLPLGLVGRCRLRMNDLIPFKSHDDLQVFLAGWDLSQCDQTLCSAVNVEWREKINRRLVLKKNCFVIEIPNFDSLLPRIFQLILLPSSCCPIHSWLFKFRRTVSQHLSEWQLPDNCFSLYS